MVLQSNRCVIDGSHGRKLKLIRRSDPDSSVIFTIRGVVGEGGCAVCYDAQCGSKRGRLKEFYPHDTADSFFFLERTEDNQLIPVGTGMRQRFAALCDGFVSAYDTLEQVKTENHLHEVMNNFIPSWEVLYGLGPDGQRASVYIWTPDDKKGQNFEDYLQQVREKPTILPEHKLYNVLSTLITLTDCIRLFHSAGLLHLDIKPSNFLVAYNSEMNINTANISLFDVNSISSVHQRQLFAAGTPGFRAPELLRGRGENRSDIYSIGAMLYYAVVGAGKPAAFVYSDGDYEKISQLVEQSPLICASRTNSSMSVKYLLAKIMKSCLHKNPDRRYDCCEELIADLKKARTYLLPDIFSAHLGNDQRLAILDRADAANRAPGAAMRKLLYHLPLYTALPPDEQNLQVLVIGTGTFGQRFMDLCLQVGQMNDCTLRIDAFSQDADLSRDVYLHYRPALKDFVDVEGAGCGGEEPYASVFFRETSRAFEKGEPFHNGALAQDILDRCVHPCRYIFISLGDDDLNQEVAQAFCRTGQDCPVAFVIQTSAPSDVTDGTPVYVNMPIDDNVDTELDRMALNAHLCWMDRGNPDLRGAKKALRDRYNYYSSLSFVLSIPYKLRSIGITEPDFVKAAALFQERFAEDSAAAREIFGQLISLEHRRWVLDKVTQGWMPLTDDAGKPDLEAFQRLEKTSDKRTKRHICILRSRADMPLTDPDYNWDEPNDADSLLDPVDRMSVDLHRYLLEQAELLRASQPMRSGDIPALQQLCWGESQSILQAFRQYFHCLQNILDGNRNYSRLYRQYEEDLLSAIQRHAPHTIKDAQERLAWIRKQFFCAIESNLYRNYKANDKTLVRNIPFILTGQFQSHIAMAFNDAQRHAGCGDVLFDNVASATVLLPRKITYLYWMDDRTDTAHFLQKVKSVQNYLARRHIDCRISFLVAVCRCTEEQIAQLRNGIKKIRAALRILPCKDRQDATEKLFDALKEKKPELFDGSTHLFGEQAVDSPFVSRIRSHLPYFEFDRESQSFPLRQGCEYLRHMQGHVHLRIDDLFALMGVTDIRVNHPEIFGEYEALWSICTGDAYLTGPNAFEKGVANWNRLCCRLDAYAQEHDVIAQISLDPALRSTERHTTFFVPGYGSRAVERLLDDLVRAQVLEAKSTVCGYTSDTCKVDLYTHWDIGGIMEDLLSAYHILADHRYLRCERKMDGETTHVVLYYDDLEVRNLSLEAEIDYTVLEQLYQQHLISRLRRSDRDPNLVSFVYTAPRIKQLLTTPGELLELYTYYEVMKLGYFDDAACGYEFRWDADGTITELDCVLTKGMRSMTIVCKTKKQLGQDCYHELARVSHQLGIGIRKVLIANNCEYGDRLIEENVSLADIITIRDSADIRNIGQTLRRIMEDSK